MGQNIGTVGGWVKVVTGEIGAPGAKFQFIFFDTIPCGTTIWLQRAVSICRPAARAGKFFPGDAFLNKGLKKFVGFSDQVQFTNAAVDPTGGHHA